MGLVRTKQEPEHCSNFRLWRHYISIVVRSAMQYKMSFFFTALGQFLVSFHVFLGIHFMFLRFSQVKGYTYDEVLLCYSVLLMSFSLAECFARGFDGFGSLVRQGTFDRIMVRPRSPVLQVLGSRFELSRIGRMFQAVVMFVWGIRTSDVNWSLQRVWVLFMMLLGGTVLFTGIFMIYAALCFFTLEGLEFMNVLTDGAKEHGKYPLDIYGKRIFALCTYIIPYTLVQYYPLQVILGRTNRWYYGLYPLGTVLFLGVCYGIWRFGVKHYQSAGS